MVDQKTLDYYSSQSVSSDPNKYAYLFNELPDEVEEICGVIRGIIVHQYDTKRIHGFDIPESRQFEPSTRYVSKILETVTSLQDAPLTVAREPQKRFIGLCRDFAIMFCSILRHKGIPARLRCGFTTYYEKGMYVDHWLCEYWNEKEGRWVLVDTEVDEGVRVAYNIDASFNSYNVQPSEFINPGRAWLLCRSGKADPNKFGVPDIKIAGLWFVMGSLIRDLASLNKTELLPWDYTKYTDRQVTDIKELKDKEIKLNDNVAELIDNVYENWEGVIKIYQDNPEVQIKDEVISYPTDKPRKTLLKTNNLST